MKRYPKRGPLFLGALLIGQLSLVGAIAISQVSAAGGRHTAAMAPMSAAAMAQMSHAAAQGPVLMLHRRLVHITISNYAFHPARLEVSPGTRIVWTNTDSDPHTVDSTKNVWSSEALDTDTTFARQFKKTGTFPYYCSIHPFMRATIIVKG
ncbi:MAG TPA: cupredoxin domain-containing protein [Chloroflexota bacterium]|nr:cupredoxin domain-containing protein [Chloroflexota bacterium]